MKRLKPEPIPPIHPMPEYLAEGARKAAYDDTKAVLGVPWMGVVTMAFCHYPTFYDTLWQGLRPVCLSEQYHAATARLRSVAETEAARLDPPPLAGPLAERGYAPREVAGIAATVEIFSAGNMPYVAIAMLARLLLEGGSFGAGAAAPTPAPAPKAPVASLILMEAHHAEAATRALYEDIKTRLGLPFVNTDYRALARWPSYFRLAWDSLRPQIGTEAHERAVANIHDAAVAIARALPNPTGLDATRLRAAAEQDASVGEVLEMVRLFVWLIPGLMANVAYFQAQLPPPR